MIASQVMKNPYNIVITSLGEQDNVTITRVLSNILIEKGFVVATGRIFGTFQQSGSAMSHFRVSPNNSTWSPQIPNGKGDLVISLEPSEAIRALVNYGNTHVKVLTNIRPIHSPEIRKGNGQCPTPDQIQETLKDITERVWVIDADGEAEKIGLPALRSIIMIGAVAGIEVLPITRDDFKKVIMEKLPARRLDINLNAFDIGRESVIHK